MEQENKKCMTIFCANVRNIRKVNKLSKKEMAKILGIGVKGLNSLENGVIPVRMNCAVIVRLSIAFNLPVSYILEKFPEA